MKKLTLIISAIFFLQFNGCGAVKGLMTYKRDASLSNVENIHAISTMSSVGFEWSKLNNNRIQGINIYRKEAALSGVARFKRIGTIDNRHATHFLDTHVLPNRMYTYLFTTYSFGKESKGTDPVSVRTKAPYEAVSFVKAYKVASSVVKVLWKPHNNQAISGYIIERSVNGGTWKFVSLLKGRLTAEYIDMFIMQGRKYNYRIIAQSYDKIKSIPSQNSDIHM